MSYLIDLLRSWFFSVASAAADLPPVVLLEPINGGSGAQEVNSLNDYLVPAFQLLLGLSAAIAVIQFAYGGFEYMFSQIPGAKGDGKERMKSAVFGLIVVLASWVILNEVNPAILSSNPF